MISEKKRKENLVNSITRRAKPSPEERKGMRKGMRSKPTVKPHFSTPAFNKILLIEHTDFRLKI